MSSNSTIEWTDATWNPVTGCTLVSEGCRNCYAAHLAATRLRHHPSRDGLATMNADGVAKFTGKVRFNEEWLDQPLRWAKPRMIFVCAHGDLFHESVPQEWIRRVFDVMSEAKNHTFQVLTKRPERLREWFAWEGRVLPNVWIGTSVEDQATASERIPHLMQCPAVIRFLSCEPLLGPVDLTELWVNGDPDQSLNALQGIRAHPDGTCSFGDGIAWVIVGGESGKNARPMHPDWPRRLRDQCQRAGVAYHFKQWGNWSTVYDRDHDDPDWRRCPQARSNAERYLNIEGGHGFHNERVVFVRNVGKKAAGRLLDGRTWDEFPGLRKAEA